MNLQETFKEAERLQVEFWVTEDFRLTGKPKSNITAKLRAAIKEHKSEITCEVMWQMYLMAIGVEQEDLPSATPNLKSSYGNPKDFAAAIEEYDFLRKCLPLFEHEIESGNANPMILTKSGLVFLMPQEVSNAKDE